jgi:hypothetical protein
MGKVKNFKQEVEILLFVLYGNMGIDKPENHDDILEFIANDVQETADPLNWHDGDVAIAFRRWIEEQNIPKKNDTRSNYFHINKQGWDNELQREEVQVHCGENGNLLLIKTDEGFIIDVYDIGGNNIHTATIWEDDINPLVDDDTNDSDNFSDVELNEFKKKWGQYHNEITANLGYPLKHSASDELLMVDYFWNEEEKMWYPKSASLYSEREQAIADYLRML